MKGQRRTNFPTRRAQPLGLRERRLRRSIDQPIDQPAVRLAPFIGPSVWFLRPDGHKRAVTRLRRSDTNGTSIARRGCGRGFSYNWSTGQRVTDIDVIERIRQLAIPPAWRDVWICPWPNGHIQAMGTDAAGRRQYRYHDDWRKHRNTEKYERAEEFGRALPVLRRAVGRDLAASGLGKRRVQAAGVRLLDIGCFRVGSEEYAEEHETYGVATLLKEHVTLHGDELVFDYSAKGSIPRSLTINDSETREVLSALRRRRGGSDELLAWKDTRTWVDIRAGDINAYIKEEAGEQFSAKDFRTWSGTVFMALVLGRDARTAQSKTGRKRTITAAIKEVAAHLGNTPAVCRSSYVDPRVIDRFQCGETIAGISHLEQAVAGWPEMQCQVEEAVLELLADVEALVA
jgi:DNA topoisomerase-1